MRLRDRVVLVTGGAEGIGKATAIRCAAEGARVAIADLDEAAAARTLETIHTAGGDARFFACDVRQEEAVRAAVEGVQRVWGRLHVLVNSAGILQGAFQNVEALSLETFAGVLDVNLLGTFLCCKHAAPLIEASGGGVILCLSSGGGIRGASSSLAYGASKAGVQGFCLTLERQLAPRGIRVNVVCPGALDTPMKRQNVMDGARSRGEDPERALQTTPLGDPDGVARILAFLASPEADYVVGTVHTR